MGQKKLDGKRAKAPRNRSHAFERILRLTPERQMVIDNKLQKGVYPSDIAKMMQTEWGESTDITTDSLKKTIERYRASYLIPRLQHAREKEANGEYGRDTKVAPVARSVLERLDVMDHYERVIKMQWSRICKAYEREQAMPVTTDAVTKLLKDYNTSLNHYANLQMETGYLKRVPKVLTGQIGLNDSTAPDHRAVFEFALTQQQQEQAGVVDMAQLLHEVIEGEYERVESGGGPVPAQPAPHGKKA